jgi:peptidoglycan/xylan/chitin deacetylase (PgdA/CDA1 family)
MAADPQMTATAGAARLAPERTRRLVGLLRERAADALPRAVLARRGHTARKQVALTFDDGPNDMTDAYLEMLDRYRARATFFVVGAACAHWPDAVQRIADRGHELAGHGYTHTQFPTLGSDLLREELHRTQGLLPAPRTPRPLVRPPGGAISLRSLLVSAHAGYATIHWSLDSDDCRTDSPDDVAARVHPDALKPGDIVLLHEGQSWTLAALPKIFETLAARGWQAVTVGDLLWPGGRSAP